MKHLKSKESAPVNKAIGITLCVSVFFLWPAGFCLFIMTFALSKYCKGKVISH